MGLFRNNYLNTKVTNNYTIIIDQIEENIHNIQSKLYNREKYQNCPKAYSLRYV